MCCRGGLHPDPYRSKPVLIYQTRAFGNFFSDGKRPRTTTLGRIQSRQNASRATETRLRGCNKRADRSNTAQPAGSLLPLQGRDGVHEKYRRSAITPAGAGLPGRPGSVVVPCRGRPVFAESRAQASVNAPTHPRRRSDFGSTRGPRGPSSAIRARTDSGRWSPQSPGARLHRSSRPVLRGQDTAGAPWKLTTRRPAK